MTEEFKTSQNTEEEEVLVNLTLDPEEEPAPQDDLGVSGEHKSHKKKKGNGLYTLIIVLLLGVMGYSGYRIASTLLENKEADDVYADIANQFIVEEDQTLVPEWTEPEQTETLPVETEEQPAPTKESRPTETEESVSLVTIENEPETAPPTTAAPVPSTAAPAPLDPMRILNINFNSLKNANRDTIAWIQGMGGVINYPVVQCDNNSYYLKHLFDGRENPNGTIFVHCENRFLKDDVTFIFGHHMRSGKMFGFLTDYESRSFFNNNPEFRLYTPGKIYTLRVFAVFRGLGTERITLNYANANAFNSNMNAYAARSMHPSGVTVSYGDKIVCLCTCSRHIEDGRFFVYCKVMNPD